MPPRSPKKKPSLRKRAELLLKKQAERLESLSTSDINHLIHELGTYQIELEMQNEELRNAQLELEASRRKYADLYDFAPIGYFIFDRYGKILETNHTGAVLLGMGKSLLKGKPFPRFIAGGEDRNVFTAHLAEVLRTQAKNACEIRLKGKDGDLFHARLQSIPAGDGAGDTALIRAAMIDISEQKQAENALRENEERYRSLVEFSPDAVVVHCQGKFEYVNPAGVALFGAADAADIVGKNVLDLVHPADRDVVVERMRQTYEEKVRAPLREIRILRLDGEPAFVEAAATPITYSCKPATQVVVRDITKRKLAEEAAQRERDLLQAVMNGAKNSHLVYLDREFNFVRVNETYAATCGYRPEEMIGKNHFALYPHAENEAIFARVRDTGEMFEVRDKPFKFPDQPERGVTYWDWILTPVKNPAGGVEGLIFSLYETTARKRAEEALRAAHTELERRAYELDAVNRELESFSYTVSHDLKAPLRSIDGFTKAILEDYAERLDETGRDYLTRVHSASQRMTHLIDAMLNMARLTRGELREKTVDLSSLAQVIAHEIRKQDPGRQVEFVIQKNVKAKGDQEMLLAMLENLLDNAWKFTSKHPTAKIEFGTVDLSGKTVYFVRDDGAGFDTAFSDKLFKPFKRLHTESEFPGIGIGLAIAHRIVMRHGGRLWAESAPEKGATFYFTLG